MKLHVAFTPDEISAAELAGAIAVVTDVIRATTTMIEALANGARCILPVPTIEEAARLGQKLARETTLLCGERRSRPIEGFDLGNSPVEFSAANVSGKTLVMSTTNGTAALLASNGAARVLVGAFTNISAITRAVVESERDVVIVCAGKERRFALEDALFAGALTERLRAKATVKGNDAAAAAATLAKKHEKKLRDAFEHTAAGRQLIEAGYSDDLGTCASLDRHDIAPELRDREVTA